MTIMSTSLKEKKGLCCSCIICRYRPYSHPI